MTLVENSYCSMGEKVREEKQLCFQSLITFVY